MKKKVLNRKVSVRFFIIASFLMPLSEDHLGRDISQVSSTVKVVNTFLELAICLNFISQPRLMFLESLWLQLMQHCHNAR